MRPHCYPTQTKSTWPLLALMLAVSTTSAEAATWYIATTGTNSTSCGASASPCATPDYAVNTRSASGDTILIQPGNYAGWDTTSTARTNLTIAAANPNNKPIITSSTRVRAGWNNMVLDNLRIRGGTSPGGAGSNQWSVLRLQASGATLRNSEIFNGGMCVSVEATRNLNIHDNDIHNCGTWGVDDAHGIIISTSIMPTGWADKAYIHHNHIHDGAGDAIQDYTGQGEGSASTYVEIAYNNMHGWDEDGVDFKGNRYVRIHHNDIYNNGGREWGNGINTQDVYALGGDYEIWDNEIYQNWGSAIFQKWGAPRMKVWNNLIYNNSHKPQYNSFAIISEAGCAMEFYNNVVVNNTSTNSNKAGGIHSTCSNNVYKNNILYNNGVGQYGNIMGSSGEGLGTFERNYVYPTSPGKTGNNAITSCYQSGNCPGLVNISNGDFHLLSGSPNVDVGLALTSLYATDYAGTFRPQGGGWDIGPYEYGGVITALQPPSNLKVVP